MDMCVRQHDCMDFTCTPAETQFQTTGSTVVKPLTFHPGLSHTTHSSLQVCDTLDSPQVDVKVLDLSQNICIPVTLKSTDTIATLIKKCLEQRPNMLQLGNLIYNGKPVLPYKSLENMGVKSGAMFITFQKCIGG